MFPFPCSCLQFHVDVVAAAAKPCHLALKDTSAEGKADILPPGGVCRYYLLAQGQTGTMDIGAVVAPGQAGLGVQPAR